MKKWVKGQDMFSPKIGLYFDGNPRYFSMVGLLMTFAFLGEVLGFGIYFFLQFLSGEQTSLSYSKEAAEREVSGDLSKKALFYSIRDSNGNTVTPKLIESFPTFWKEDETKINIENLTKRYCPENLTGSTLFDFDPSNFTCLSRENNEPFLITRDPSSNFMTYINIFFARCKNTTENENHCYPKEKIDDLLRKGNYYLYIYSETYHVNNHKKKPIYSQIYSDKVHIPVSRTDYYYYSMREVNYVSEEGLVIQNKKNYIDFGLDLSAKKLMSFPQEKKFYIDDSLLVIQLAMDASYIEKYQRTYQKLQSLAANVGGIGSICYFFSELVTFLFCRGSIILAINDAASGENKSELLKFQKLKESIGLKNKTNNFIKIRKQSSLRTMRPGKLTELGRKTSKNFCLTEILFYRCWKKRVNCVYLRDCEKCVERFLDVRNIIHFWKEFECYKLDYSQFETSGSQKQIAGFSSTDLLQNNRTPKSYFFSDFDIERKPTNTPIFQ